MVGYVAIILYTLIAYSISHLDEELCPVRFRGPSEQQHAGSPETKPTQNALESLQRL